MAHNARIVGRSLGDANFMSSEISSATNLPTLKSSTPKPQDFGLVESAPFSPTNTTSSQIERENILIKAWALLLHHYSVSDPVCFVVTGKLRDGDIHNRQDALSVVSRWSRSSSHPSLEPQLQFETYAAAWHSKRSNTLLRLGEPTQVDGEFSYVLEWDVSKSPDIRLCARRNKVPPKFATSLWGALLEQVDLLASGRMKNETLSDADREVISKETTYPLFEEQLCLHQLFQESVRIAPSAEAVAAFDGSLTYTELDELSDVLAARLIEQGNVWPGKYVPFSFEKSMWMVVAMLGILKAGGAIVSIDPSQPIARASEILKEIQADVIVTSSQQASRFDDIPTGVISVSAQTMRAPQKNTLSSKKLPIVRPNSPSMIIFTSGSTGKPKGIVIQHGASSTRFVTEGKALSFQGARTLQFAASTWDVFMTDIFATLIHRGCVCVPSEEDRRSNLAKFCKEKRVTLALITPSLAGLLDPHDFPTLKTIILGGEALRKDVAQKWKGAAGVKLLQGYGPAETGFIVGTSKKNVELSDRPAVIGYAQNNSVCVLVDPNNHNLLVPRGATGELVVGGPTLFQKYLNDAEKTKLATIKNPRWASDLDCDVRRFYKTGDLLHQSLDSLDGCFEFVGRKDDQIKYHGQRIEVKEIEHHLSSIADAKSRVISCMVVLPQAGILRDKLVAVVECETNGTRSTVPGLAIRDGDHLSLSTVRTALSDKLPAYMIPNELVVVHAIPHNSAMKMDRARVKSWLSELHSDSGVSISGYDFASEKLLAHETTARALSRHYSLLVSGDDKNRRQAYEDRDFNLHAGGIDSINIISLSTFISRHYEAQIPVSDLLSSKATIRSIASIIDKKTTQNQRTAAIDLSTAESEVSLQLQAILPGSSGKQFDVSIKNVFMTGATGFLGVEILHQLITQTNCHVYILVRSSTEDTATQRVIERAQEAGWWDQLYISRFTAWIGDLTKPRLGLSSTQLQILRGNSAHTIDTVIHNGAKVHYNLDYDSLKAVNVTSTVELIQLLNERTSPLKSFVFVSGGQQLSFADDDDEENLSKALNGSGYARSKAMSELFVKKFATQQQGSKVEHAQVVKPGFIIGDASRGVGNQADFIWRLIASCVEIGAYNKKDEHGWLFISDIARVSRAVLEGVFKTNLELSVKVLDGIRFKDLWNLLRDSFGYDLQSLDPATWLSRIRKAVAEKQEAHAMFPLLHLLEGNDEPIGVLNGPLQATQGVENSIKANVEWFRRIGFMPDPSSAATPTSSNDYELVDEDAFNVATVRKEFPALHHGVVAFNNAAGTVLHQDAMAGTQKYMTAFPYELGRNDAQSQAKTENLIETYGELAAFMGADPDEVAFGQTTTFLLRMLGQALKPSLNSDCEIVVSNLCHEASAAAWIALAKDLGIAIKWWAPPAGGDDPCLSVETLKPLLSSKTRIVACNHVSNVVGTIHPIRQVADLVHSIPGAILIVDGVAFAPHRPIDVKAFDVDFYCFSWYKVFGPHVAQLYGRRSVQKRFLQGISHFFLSDMPGLDWRLRLGANSFELEAALVPITRYLKRVGWDNIVAQEALLQDIFLSYLRRRPETFRIFGEKQSNPGKRVPVITFRIIGESCLDVTNTICQKGRFRVVSGNCWAPRPTHDVLGLDEDGLIRVSFVHYNTVAEVKEFCKELDLILTSKTA
ncbi:hypothetical protein QQS21_009652 [Conoideocrella luteorostrata]|uniref:Nonribosomal peptide synthase n=1 Tax=Conoideocrella luteorostrata TaxID=1105319 RepID=A0AAJ0CIV5_9HYPO|nr:hypothetical protein QQS21_009652 [Conoideocrella luteorostrata]